MTTYSQSSYEKQYHDRLEDEKNKQAKRILLVAGTIVLTIGYNIGYAVCKHQLADSVRKDIISDLSEEVINNLSR